MHCEYLVLGVSIVKSLSLSPMQENVIHDSYDKHTASDNVLQLALIRLFPFGCMTHLFLSILEKTANIVNMLEITVNESRRGVMWLV